MSKKLRKRKTIPLRLTKLELAHLRDLFSVLLANKAEKTVSQALAEAEGRTLVEARLWQRIAEVCKAARLPMDEDAPDFICAAVLSPPPVGVFRIAQEPDEGENESVASEETDVFGGSNGSPCKDCGTHHRPHCDEEE